MTKDLLITKLIEARTTRTSPSDVAEINIALTELCNCGTDEDANTWATYRAGVHYSNEACADSMDTDGLFANTIKYHGWWAKFYDTEP